MVQNLAFIGLALADIFFRAITGDRTIANRGRHLLKEFIAHIAHGINAGQVRLHPLIGDQIPSAAHLQHAFEQLSIRQIANKQEAGIHLHRQQFILLHIAQHDRIQAPFTLKAVHHRIPDELHLRVL